MIKKIYGLYRKDFGFLFQTAISFSMRVLSALSIFAVTVIVGRKLGATESGYFFIAFSVVSFLSGIVRMGLDNTVLRFTGSSYGEVDWSGIHLVLISSLRLTAVIGFIISVLLFLLSGLISDELFGKPDLADVFKFISPAVLFVSLFTLIAMSLQGMQRIPASVFILNISANLVLIALVVLFDLSSAYNVALVYSIACLMTLAVGGGIWLLSVKKVDFNLKPDWQSIFNSCMPLWVVMIMQQTTQWSGQMIAGAYVSPENVAQLAAAQRTAMLTSFILMAVNMVVAPRFATLHKKEKYEDLRNLALRSVKLMVTFALPIVCIMLLFPSSLLSLFGDDFKQGSILLQILTIGQFINVATGSVGYLLSMSGHEKDLRNAVLISGPLAVLLAFVLTPLWGVTGSAIATATAVATQNLLAVYWVKRRLGFNTLKVW